MNEGKSEKKNEDKDQDVKEGGNNSDETKDGDEQENSNEKEVNDEKENEGVIMQKIISLLETWDSPEHHED